MKIESQSIASNEVCMQSPRFEDCGDCALLVHFGNSQTRILCELILDLHATFVATRLHGILEAVPAFSSLTIFFDPLLITRDEVEAGVRALLPSSLAAVRSAGHSASRKWTLPATYGGDRGPDLPFIAASTGLSESAVIEMHSAQPYYVYMLGFLPGFAYLGDLPEVLRLPRRSSPRSAVPKGTIAIASTMTAVYPLESPGGWHLIGATPVPLWDFLSMDEPLLKPGDAVVFKPVGEAEAGAIRVAIADGLRIEPDTFA